METESFAVKEEVKHLDFKYIEKEIHEFTIQQNETFHFYEERINDLLDRVQLAKRKIEEQKKAKEEEEEKQWSLKEKIEGNSSCINEEISSPEKKKEVKKGNVMSCNPAIKELIKDVKGLKINEKISEKNKLFYNVLLVSYREIMALLKYDNPEIFKSVIIKKNIILRLILLHFLQKGDFFMYYVLNNEILKKMKEKEKQEQQRMVETSEEEIKKTVETNTSINSSSSMSKTMVESKDVAIQCTSNSKGFCENSDAEDCYIDEFINIIEKIEDDIMQGRGDEASQKHCILLNNVTPFMEDRELETSAYSRMKKEYLDNICIEDNREEVLFEHALVEKEIFDGYHKFHTILYNLKNFKTRECIKWFKNCDITVKRKYVKLCYLLHCIMYLMYSREDRRKALHCLRSLMNAHRRNREHISRLSTFICIGVDNVFFKNMFGNVHSKIFSYFKRAFNEQGVRIVRNLKSSKNSLENGVSGKNGNEQKNMKEGSGNGSKIKNEKEEEGRRKVRKRKKEKSIDTTDEGKERNLKTCVKITEGSGKKKRKKGCRSLSISTNEKYGIMSAAFRSVSDMEEFIEQTRTSSFCGKKKCKLEKILRKNLMKYEGEIAEKRKNKGKRKAEIKGESKRRKLDNKNYVLCKKKYSFKIKETPKNIPVLHNNIYKEEYSTTLFDNEYVLKREDCSNPMSEDFLEKRLRDLIKREEQRKNPFFYNGSRQLENGSLNLILPKIKKDASLLSLHKNKKKEESLSKSERKELGFKLNKGWFHYVHNCTKDIFSEISETKNFAEFSLQKNIKKRNELYYRKEYIEEEDPVYLYEQSENEMSQMYEKSRFYQNYKVLNRAIQYYDDKNTKITKGSNHFLNSGYVYNALGNSMKEENHQSIYNNPHNITPYNVHMLDVPNYSHFFSNMNTFQYLHNSCFHRVPNTCRRKFQKCKILNRIYRGRTENTDKKPFAFLRIRGISDLLEEKKTEELPKKNISGIEILTKRFGNVKANTIYISKDYINNVLNKKKKNKEDLDFFNTDDSLDDSDNESHSSEGSNTSFKSNHSSGFSTENFFIDSDNDEKIKKGMSRVKEEVDNIKEDYLKKNTMMTLLNTKNYQANNRAVLSNKGSRITKTSVDVSRILLSNAFSNKDLYALHNMLLDYKNHTLCRRMYLYFKSKGYFPRNVFRSRKKGESSEEKKRKKKKKSNSSSKLSKKNKKDKHTKKNRKGKRRSYDKKKKKKENDEEADSSKKIIERKDSSEVDSGSNANKPETQKLAVSSTEKENIEEEKLGKESVKEDEKKLEKEVKVEESAKEENEEKTDKNNNKGEEEKKIPKRSKSKSDKTEGKEKERKKDDELSNKKEEKSEKSTLGLSINFGLEDLLEFTKKSILFDKINVVGNEKENSGLSVKNFENKSLKVETKKEYLLKEKKKKLEKIKEEEKEEKEKCAEKEKTEENIEKDANIEKLETEKKLEGMGNEEKEEVQAIIVEKEEKGVKKEQLEEKIQIKKEKKEEKEIYDDKVKKQEEPVTAEKEKEKEAIKEKMEEKEPLEEGDVKEIKKAESVVTHSEKENIKREEIVEKERLPKEKTCYSEESKKENNTSKKDNKHSMKCAECRTKKEKKEFFFGSFKRNLKKRRHEADFSLEDKDMKRNKKESNDSKSKKNQMKEEFITRTIMKSLTAATNRVRRRHNEDSDSNDGSNKGKRKKKTNKENEKEKKNNRVNKKGDGSKDKNVQHKAENHVDKDKGNKNEKEEKPKEEITLEKKVFIHLESPLSILVCGGLVSSKKLIEAQAIFKENNKRLQVAKKNTTFNSDMKNGNRSNDKNKNKNGKQEQGALIPNSLAVEVDLGARFFFHSSFTCPISRDKSSKDNGPYLLPCGHAICKNCLDKIHAQRPRQFKCPMCPQYLHILDILPLYFN